MARQAAVDIKDLLQEYSAAKLHHQTPGLLDLASLEEELIERSNEFKSAFTIQCDVLSAVLRVPRVNGYQRHVSTVLSSVCDLWWTGKVDVDKVKLQFSQICGVANPR